MLDILIMVGSIGEKDGFPLIFTIEKTNSFMVINSALRMYSSQISLSINSRCDITYNMYN